KWSGLFHNYLRYLMKLQHDVTGAALTTPITIGGNVSGPSTVLEGCVKFTDCTNTASSTVRILRHTITGILLSPQVAGAGLTQTDDSSGGAIAVLTDGSTI